MNTQVPLFRPDQLPQRPEAQVHMPEAEPLWKTRFKEALIALEKEIDAFDEDDPRYYRKTVPDILMRSVRASEAVGIAFGEHGGNIDSVKDMKDAQKTGDIVAFRRAAEEVLKLL